MQTDTLIQKLRERIQVTLSPIINNDYVYLDLPYHGNIGDTLIWEGTREFLKSLPYRCLYYSNKDSFRYRELGKNVIILLHGGGNFGDLYRQHSEFRKKIIELYPENKVIVLPQTIYYEDMNLLADDADFYSSHSNVTICAREQYSYDFISEYFRNRVLLVPDMAFFLDLSKYKIPADEGRVLYLKRTDKELITDDGKGIPDNAETHDWPTYETQFKEFDKVERFCYRINKALSMFHANEKLTARIEDWKRNFYYRRTYVQMGISFLAPYHTIYTTRLHVLILGVLLDKNIYLINNSSGKVINFYNTWLKKLTKITKM